MYCNFFVFNNLDVLEIQFHVDIIDLFHVNHMFCFIIASFHNL